MVYSCIAISSGRALKEILSVEAIDYDPKKLYTLLTPLEDDIVTTDADKIKVLEKQPYCLIHLCLQVWTVCVS